MTLTKEELSARAKRAWETIRIKKEQEIYLRGEKNKIRSETIEKIKKTIPKGGHIILLESVYWLMAKELQDYNLYVRRTETLNMQYGLAMGKILSENLKFKYETFSGTNYRDGAPMITIGVDNHSHSSWQKEKKRQYQQRPDVKEKARKYERKYRQRLLERGNK